MTRDRDRASAASVRVRLLNRAKRDGEELQRVLVLYANERVLYRLSRSVHAQAFVLKGASLFALWHGRIPRATKDIDLLGSGSPDAVRLREAFREILGADVEADGLVFDLGSVHAEPIREESIYDGVRVTFRATLGTAQLALQVHVGFGDAVEPLPEEVDYPTLLEAPAPRLRAYRREVLVAEKFHAMVSLGLANSRMKDYFDIAFLATQFSFRGADLARAIEATFARRQTPLPGTVPVGLTEQFALDAAKRAQWTAFGRRVLGTVEPLEVAVERVRALVWPAAQAAGRGEPFEARWTSGRWIDRQAIDATNDERR